MYVYIHIYVCMYDAAIHYGTNTHLPNQSVPTPNPALCTVTHSSATPALCTVTHSSATSQPVHFTTPMI